MSVNGRLRFEVLQRDSFRCRYCGVPSNRAQLEVDHLLPRSRGGSDCIENLITACRRCNQGKFTSIQVRSEVPEPANFAEHHQALNTRGRVAAILRWGFSSNGPLGNPSSLAESLSVDRSTAYNYLNGRTELSVSQLHHVLVVYPRLRQHLAFVVMDDGSDMEALLPLGTPREAGEG